MYDVIGLRNWLVGRLYQHLTMPVVPNDDSPRPAKPFLAYTITSPYIPQAAPPVIEYSDVTKTPPAEEGEEPGAPENWSRKQRTEYPTIVWSITAVADTQQGCYEAVLQARRWFALDGRDALKVRGIVVARLEPVQDRSLILDETQAEYRAGFDVALRVQSQISIDIETIETVEYASTRSES